MVERIVVGPLYANAYIFSVGKKECFVIDPGGDAEQIVKRLEVLNLKPHAILLTHGHMDHTAAAESIRKLYAKKDIYIKTAIHELDKQFIGKKAETVNRESFSFFGSEGEELFENLYSGMPDADIILKEGENVLDSDLVVIHTPGHTEGSICFYSEERELLFSGDTLFFEGVGRTDLEGGSYEDLLVSIKEKLFKLPPQTRVFPGHGPLTTIEREMKFNPFVN